VALDRQCECECDEERAGKRGGRMVEFVTADAREEPESLT
jgi:hypothetical protein